MKKHDGNISPRSLIGLGLIVFAILLFFNNIGLKFLGVILSNWPVALIVIGGALLYSPRQTPKDSGSTEEADFSHDSFMGKARSSSLLPYFLIVIGILFFLAQHRIFNFGIGAIIAPLVLIFIGLQILRPKSCFGKCRKHDEGTELISQNDSTDVEQTEFEADESLAAADSDDSKIDIFAVLGGGNYSTRSQSLTGGNIFCLMGGAEVDIRDADTQNDKIEIDVLALLGGAVIKIPPHWQVSVKVLPFLGGITNKTTCLAEKMRVPKKHVIITGIAFLGGVEIRN